MTAEQREREEARGSCFGPLVEKVESYLREHFSGESAGASPEAARELLMQVALDWCLNRGVKMSGEDISAAVREGMRRHNANWSGKVEGEDTRGRSFGKPGSPAVKGYSSSIA